MSTRTRWNGVRRASVMRGASVAVAGACLASAAASGYAATAEDAAFESEFEPAAEAEAVAPAEAPAASVVELDIAIAEAGDDGIAGQSLAAYLDRLVRRAEDVDAMPDCLPEKPQALAAVDLFDVLGDVDDATEAAWREAMDEFAGTLAAEPAVAVADGNADVDVDADADVDVDANADADERFVVLADTDDATEAAWREVMDELAGTPAPDQPPAEPAAAAGDEPAVPEASAAEPLQEEENVRIDFFP